MRHCRDADARAADPTMSEPDTGARASRQRSGRVLVALQFALLLALGALAVRAMLAKPVPPGVWALWLTSAVVGVWALRANRPGNFNIQPLPREGGVLVRQGPYRWIRHPMYTCVLLFAAACAWSDGSLLAWGGTAALFAVLLAKATLEERWMSEQHPDYAAYSRGTTRFIPWVW
jgi:protein-S-isoprenylcysteine O-methyltransferase Ste14